MDIHDRLLGKEVIDAEDRIFREDRVRNSVEVSSRLQIPPERFFDNDPRTLG